MPATRPFVRLVACTVACAVTVLAAGCAGGSIAAECEPLVEGAEIVANDGPGEWAVEGVSPRFVQLWRAGGLNEGEELAWPAPPAASRDGRLAIPDWELGEVIEVDSDGTWHGARAPSGPGPGEVQRPAAAVWDADGTLALLDIGGNKVVRLGPEGPRPDVPLPPDFLASAFASGEIRWVGVLPDGTALLKAPLRPGPAGGSAIDALLRLAPGRPVADTVAAVRVPVVSAERFGDIAVPGWPRPLAAVGAGGRLAVAGLDASYRVLVYEDGARAVRQICRVDAEPAPFTAREQGEGYPPALASVEEAIGSAERPPVPPALGALVLGASGRLWAQRERTAPFGDGIFGIAPGARWDVFDADGSYLGAVRAPEDAYVMAAAADTVFAYEVGEYDETWVVAYRLEIG